MTAPGTRRFAAAVSQHPVASTAIGEVVGQVLDAVGFAPDVALLFVTAPYRRAVPGPKGATRGRGSDATGV